VSTAITIRIRFPSYPKGNDGVFSGGKAAGAEIVPTSTLRGVVSPVPVYVFMVWCLGTGTLNH